jgi:hypothetical protein
MLKKTTINLLGTTVYLISLCLPLLALGQVSEKHVTKIYRYMEKFNSYSDSLIDSMAVGDWRDVEVLTALSDMAHEAYLHSLYISGMLDMLTAIEDPSERTAALYKTTFYIKGAITFMKITNKAIITELNLTENQSITAVGRKFKKDAEMFNAELETVKNDLEYDYSYLMGTLKN